MRPLQKEIIEFLHVQPEINPTIELRRTIDFLKHYMLAHPFLKTYVLGISGGQDSTLAGRIAQIAMRELRKETGDSDYRFIAVRLPYGVQKDESDAQRALDFIQADEVRTVNIKRATDSIVQDLLESGIETSDFNKGNIKARQRMVVQYAIAGQLKGAVIGTDHAAESVTGFFTKFGDGAADLIPLWRLTKSQGKQLLQELGAPSALYNKIPTADLEDDKPLIADEVALGVTYQDIDAYLTGQVISEDAAQKIEAWYTKTRHKRHLPVTIFDTFWKA